MAAVAGAFDLTGKSRILAGIGVFLTQAQFSKLNLQSSLIV